MQMGQQRAACLLWEAVYHLLHDTSQVIAPFYGYRNNYVILYIQLAGNSLLFTFDILKLSGRWRG